MIKVYSAKTFLVCLVILNILGFMSLYSSLHQGGELMHASLLTRQFVWVVIFWIVVLVFSSINYRIYYSTSFIIYCVSLLLLIGVKLFGREIMGSQRWLTFFGIHFQPSEFSKLAIVIVLARLFSQNVAGKWQAILKKIFFPLTLVGAMSLLIFKQPDLGTASILIFVFFMMGLLTKVKRKYVVAILVVTVVTLPLVFSLLHDYQKKRLTVFLNPNVDPLGAGYTIIQSKIAIGSGRVLGKGFLSGTQNQFNFLPERHTDFIFTVVAEEFGFIGCLFLLFLFYLILAIIIEQAKMCKDSFAQFLCAGVYTIIFLHVVINIGMTMGLLPVVGLPLLFLSYGGTHLVISAVLVGIFLNISKQC